MDNLTQSINSFKDKHILVIGDIMLDRWTFGRVSKLSPEAPVPVVEKTGENVTIGGAANVANNVISLGAQVELAGVVGVDRDGELVQKLLTSKGIGAKALLSLPTRPTTEKHRIVSGGDHHLLRLDLESTEHLSEIEEVELFDKLAPLIATSDAIIFSDYAKGIFSKILSQRIIAEARTLGKITLADFKPQNKSYFYGADIISPNLKEAREMTGLHDLGEIGPRLVKDFDAYIVVTRGGEGVSVFKKEDAEEFHVPGKKIKIFDVSGAGDTAIATLALGLASGLSVPQAVMLSNEAGAIVVQKPGTATLSREELLLALQEIPTIEQTPPTAARLKLNAG